MKKSKQLSFEKQNWQHRYCHGGSLRTKRAGRLSRALSSKEPLHLVFKANKECLPWGFRTPQRFSLVHQILKKFSKQFFIKIEQVGIAGDHFHLLVRFTKRSQMQNFLRVLAGQVAQQFEKQGLMKFAVTDTPIRETTKESQRALKKKKLWKYRPFSRVVKGWKAFWIAKAYVRLNEKEGSRQITYKKQRLRGLSNTEWEILWS